MNSKPGKVIWFTGLPCSGKSTLAYKLATLLTDQGIAVEHLDGDIIRDILPGKGFSKEERNSHIREMGFLASRLEAHGVTVIASFVSPYKQSRQFVRSLCKNFVEIYISTPVEECEKRDVKGMYKKARAGEIQNFTGISDPYEPPDSAELTIDTANSSIDSCLERIVELLN